MDRGIKTTCFRRGVTLLELVLAITLVTIIFAAILPQFRLIGNSWDAKQGSAEAMQNGRVLIEHFKASIAGAVKLLGVSESSDTDGYIEFEDNAGNTIRYDIGVSGYVEYGQVGSLSDLAGPVSSLTFTCYDACNLDTILSPVSDPNLVRFVKMDTVVTNSAGLGSDKAFSLYVYLRTNGVSGSGGSWTSTYEYLNRTQGTNIFAYDGQNSSKVPSDSSTPSTVLSSGEYDKLEVDDGDMHLYSASTKNYYPMKRFVIEIDEDEGDVGQISVTWNGRGVNGKGGKTDGGAVYIWNYSGSSYEQLVVSANTEAEVVVTGSVSSSVTNYIGGAGSDTITLLVVSNDKFYNKSTNDLYTDYVEVVVSGGSSAVLP